MGILLYQSWSHVTMPWLLEYSIDLPRQLVVELLYFQEGGFPLEELYPCTAHILPFAVGMESHDYTRNPLEEPKIVSLIDTCNLVERC